MIRIDQELKGDLGSDAFEMPVENLGWILIENISQSQAFAKQLFGLKYSFGIFY